MKRLRELREDRHLSQQALADLVNTSQQNIYKYENDIHEPDIQMLKSLASVLHTSIDYLVEYDPEEFPELSAATQGTEEEWQIDVPVPDRTGHVDSDRLHLLASYDRCREPIREHILCITEELARIAQAKTSEK